MQTLLVRGCLSASHIWSLAAPWHHIPTQCPTCLILGGFAASHGFRSCLCKVFFPSAAPSGVRICTGAGPPAVPVRAAVRGTDHFASNRIPRWGFCGAVPLFPKLQGCRQHRFLTHLQFRKGARKGPGCRLGLLPPIPCPLHPFRERGCRGARQQALFRLSLKQQKDKYLRRWQANPR